MVSPDNVTSLCIRWDGTSHDDVNTTRGYSISYASREKRFLVAEWCINDVIYHGIPRKITKYYLNIQKVLVCLAGALPWTRLTCVGERVDQVNDTFVSKETKHSSGANESAKHVQYLIVNNKWTAVHIRIVTHISTSIKKGFTFVKHSVFQKNVHEHLQTLVYVTRNAYV